MFRDIVIMLGQFHMMVLGVIEIRYGDTGIRDLAVHGDIIAEGSINKVLDGKHYTHAIHYL